jgi:hypothetical protein
LDFFDGEELADLIIRCYWRTGLVVADELLGGFHIEYQPAGHDGVVGQRWAFEQALLVELGAGLLETDVPGGSCVSIHKP